MKETRTIAAPHSEPDATLLERYGETGDLAVLGELYQRHAEMVYYVCYRYLQDAEDSKDAVMQIFEELTVKVNKQEIREFGSWLYVLSRNHCLMRLRATKNKQHISIEEFVEFPALAHQETDPMEKEYVLSALEECIERLPDRQKQSITLFFLREKCYKEVSTITGYGMKDVKSYIQNGKRNLKICMEGHRGER